jgi:hypothetical protein
MHPEGEVSISSRISGNCLSSHVLKKVTLVFGAVRTQPHANCSHAPTNTHTDTAMKVS